jgi:glycerol uptake facilitator protein
MNKTLLGELISEAMAVLIIIAFGDSVACMYVLYTPKALSSPGFDK